MAGQTKTSVRFEKARKQFYVTERHRKESIAETYHHAVLCLLFPTDDSAMRSRLISNTQERNIKRKEKRSMMNSPQTLHKI
ncbi:uncharacterized protein LOC123532421 isoform X2 [Mercenaria mercenaria]|uniref:uncharacterized protein LOC123532421 isoform X2 n=1 Tax=Mercenaria mercenaria TaxID=6596 RepID=UPI00234E5747|nr:uncharacterized protein LOC123532421 isoform X2 [Mercenaria mercenaria]